jgi:hypothetical protein
MAVQFITMSINKLRNGWNAGLRAGNAAITFL